MQCEAKGCSQNATIHIRREDGSSTHLCDTHAVESGWMRQPLPELGGLLLAPSAFPAPDLQTICKLWAPLHSASDASRFYQEHRFLFVTTDSGDEAVLYAVDDADNHSVQALVSKHEFHMNRAVKRYITARADIDAWLDSMENSPS